MNISTTDRYEHVIKSIQNLNNMLKNIAGLETSGENDLIKANITAKVLGLGDKVDTSV